MEGEPEGTKWRCLTHLGDAETYYLEQSVHVFTISYIKGIICKHCYINHTKQGLFFIPTGNARNL